MKVQKKERMMWWVRGDYPLRKLKLCEWEAVTAKAAFGQGKIKLNRHPRLIDRQMGDVTQPS